MPVFGPPVITASELADTLATAVAMKLGRESSDREWTTVALDELRRIGKDTPVRARKGASRRVYNTAG